MCVASRAVLARRARVACQRVRARAARRVVASEQVPTETDDRIGPRRMASRGKRRKDEREERRQHASNHVARPQTKLEALQKLLETNG